jgi:hypothetical protein
MRHEDPGSVGQAKTPRAPAEGACHHRGEGAEPDAIARDRVEGQPARGHSKELGHRWRRKQRDRKVNGGGDGFSRASGPGSHVQADPTLSLRDAHILSGKVKGAIRAAVPRVVGVLIHMEPYEED